MKTKKDTIRKKKTYRRELLNRILGWIVALFLFDYGVYYCVSYFMDTYDICKFSFDIINDSNSIEIYVTILSLVFIVTSVVSVLSDKSEMIYWVSVMEYKLVNPAFFNLTNLSAALIANVLLSTIFLIISSRMVFLCLVCVIIVLFIITSLMMSGFFYREPVREKLEHDFLVQTLFFKIHQDLINAKQCYIDENKDKGDEYLYQIYKYGLGDSPIEKKLHYYLNIPEDELSIYSADKEIKKLFKVLYEAGVYKEAEGELDNNYDERLRIKNNEILFDYLEEGKVAQMKETMMEFDDYCHADQEFLSGYMKWKSEKEIRDTEKRLFLDKLDKLINYCHKRCEDYSEKKDELVSNSLRYIEECNINQLIENISLLNQARRGGNVKEIMSCLGRVNPEIYTHILEIVFKDIFEKRFAGITNAMLSECVANNEYIFTVEYYFNKYEERVERVIYEFNKDIFLYQHNPEGRYNIKELLERHNEELYNSIKNLNEFLFMICRENNIPMFLSYIHILNETAIYRLLPLVGRMWPVFSGYTCQAKNHGIGYQAKIKNLSWFLPEYLSLYERFLNEALAEGSISDSQISQIVDDFTEDLFESEAQRMFYDEETKAFRCNLELDYRA